MMSDIIVIVIRIQPTNMQTNAISHSDYKANLWEIYGLLYKVMHKASLQSPPSDDPVLHRDNLHYLN